MEGMKYYITVLPNQTQLTKPKHRFSLTSNSNSRSFLPNRIQKAYKFRCFPDNF